MAEALEIRADEEKCESSLDLKKAGGGTEMGENGGGGTLNFEPGKGELWTGPVMVDKTSRLVFFLSNNSFIVPKNNN